MAHRKFHAPRHGSLAFLPHKKARYTKGRIRHWADDNGGEARFVGFAAFKAGMTQLAYINDEPNSPYLGHETMVSATILDAPPLILIGIRAYEKTEYGLKATGQVLSDKPGKYLERKISLPKEYDFEEKMAAFVEKVKPDSEIRGIFQTNPALSNVPRKKPDIFEIPVRGGKDARDRVEFAKSKLGSEIRVFDVFKEGMYVDVIGVTKGKGFQGPVKRFGIKILPRKTRGTKRGVACIGPWHPARVMYTVARPGQTGFHNRVEYHKRIIKIGEKGEDVTPKGGFVRYGIVRGDYILILGSIPGPKKRLVRMRETIRPLKTETTTTPEITYLSTLSQQGK
ncbi:MAG: 50S ribosomal protein L3 [Promethearchaeota archaeon]